MSGEVPIWFWRNKAAPYGARLPKRTIRAPKVWVKVDTAAVVTPGAVTVLNARIGRRLEQKNRARKPGSLCGFEGNLQPEDYQYFWGARNRGSVYDWSMCRICRKTQMNIGERRAHLKKVASGEKLNCAQKAILVGNLVAKDGLCLICDAKTGHRKWGVPLCDLERCLTTFMFSENFNRAWEQGVKLAERLNWPKGKKR